MVSSPETDLPIPACESCADFLPDPGLLRVATDESLANRVRPGRGKARNTDRKQIQKDIPRTFGGDPEVMKWARTIEGILLDYSVADPEVGYCQGMNSVAAVVAVQGVSGDSALTRFWNIVHDIRGLWLPGFPLILSGAVAFDTLCRERLPELHKHFWEQGVTFDILLPEAWLTLFANWLPLAMLPHAYGLIEDEKFPAILALTVAVLEAHLSALLKTCDLGDLFVLLKTLAKQPQMSPNDIMTSAQDLLPKARAALTDGDVERVGTASSFCREGSVVIHKSTGLPLLSKEHLERVSVMRSAAPCPPRKPRVGHESSLETVRSGIVTVTQWLPRFSNHAYSRSVKPVQDFLQRVSK